MENDTHFMQLAINLARKNLDGSNGGPFGAVVIKDGVVVGKGSNAVLKNNDPTAHAEVVAIREACRQLGTFDLSNCIIYTSCEPCPMCLGAIYWSRIGKLFYAASKDDAAKADFDDAQFYREMALPKNQRTLPSVQLLRDEAVEVFDKWKHSEQNNKVKY